MTMTAADKIAILQRFVTAYPTDLQTVRAALADAGTPEAAQRVLVGGLNYALDMLDMFPDHFKGLGVADDGMVLRIAAKLAVARGATHAGLAKLAEEAADIAAVFDDLAAPLEKLVDTFPDREVRGRTAAKILSHKDTRIMFDADVGREAKKFVAQDIDTHVEGPERALVELRKMLEHALKPH
jgi:uncharacterized membrane protein YkvA (DUF1232 family)